MVSGAHLGPQLTSSPWQAQQGPLNQGDPSQRPTWMLSSTMMAGGWCTSSFTSASTSSSLMFCSTA